MIKLNNLIELFKLAVNFFAGLYLIFLGFELRNRQDDNTLYLAILLLAFVCLVFFGEKFLKFIKKN